MTSPLRVAILADYAEEGWPSMDLVADTLVDYLRREHAGPIEPTLIRPKMPRRLRTASSPIARIPLSRSVTAGGKGTGVIDVK